MERRNILYTWSATNFRKCWKSLRIWQYLRASDEPSLIRYQRNERTLHGLEKFL